MKKTPLILLLLLCLIGLYSQKAEASYFEMEDVPIDKVFKIKFNHEVDPSTVNNSNIHIFGGHDPKFLDSIHFSLSENKKEILVDNMEDYTPGSSYILSISRNVSSTGGNKLKEIVTMYFTVTTDVPVTPTPAILTTDYIIQRFKEAGLEIGTVSNLDNSQFGNIRKEGKRILIPSLGEDSGGRLYLFDNEDDLKTAKNYYDSISNMGPIFYSHTHQSGLFLLQMNGEMSDYQFRKYVKVMDSIVYNQ